jgi:hypothetical protein
MSRIGRTSKTGTDLSPVPLAIAPQFFSAERDSVRNLPVTLGEAPRGLVSLFTTLSASFLKKAGHRALEAGDSTVTHLVVSSFFSPCPTLRKRTGLSRDVWDRGCPKAGTSQDAPGL